MGIINKPRLAMNILNSLSAGYDFSKLEQLEIDLATKKCKTRQDIINKAIEICGEPDTPQKRYIYAKGYGWSNKEYRKHAIEYINLYLNNPLYEDIYMYRFHNIDDSIEQRKNDHILEMKEMLADTYNKEYQFEQALNIYNEIIEINPYVPIPYSKKIDTLIKMNMLDEAIKFLNDFKKSKYYVKNDKYQPRDWLIQTIDNLLIDCINKKEKGYIYKPRKRKEIINS